MNKALHHKVPFCALAAAVIFLTTSKSSADPSNRPPLLDLKTVVQTEDVPSKLVAYQCSALTILATEMIEADTESAANQAHGSRKPWGGLRIGDLKEIGKYFAEYGEGIEVAEGMNPEHANYKRGMTLMYFGKAYQDLLSEAIDQDYSVDDLLSAHMDACQTLYDRR